MVKKIKTVPLSVKVEHDVFMLLDDYYRSLNALGMSKSKLVNDAIRSHLLTLSHLKCQVDARLKGLKNRIKSE